MKVSGSTRQRGYNPGRLVSRQSSSSRRPAKRNRPPGSGCLLLRTRLFFFPLPAKCLCLVPKSVPHSMPTSRFIPLERKSRSGSSEEQFP